MTTSKVVVVVVNEISNRILIAFGEMGVKRQIERETHAQTLTQTHTDIHTHAHTSAPLFIKLFKSAEHV